MEGRESAERIALPLKVGVTGAMIVAGLGASFAPFMLAAAVKQTGINEAAAANLISSEFLAFLIMALIVMRTPKHDPRVLGVTSCLGYALGGLFAATAKSIEALYVARIVCGLAGGMMMAVTMRIIASHFTYVRLFAIAIVGNAIFSAILLFAVPATLQMSGPTAAYLTLSCVALVFAPAMVSLKIGHRVELLGKAPILLPGVILLFAYFLSRLNDSVAWQFTERLGMIAGMDEMTVGAVLSAATCIALLGPIAAIKLEKRVHAAYVLLGFLAFKAFQSLIICYVPHPIAFGVAQVIAMFAYVLLSQLFMTSFAMADASGRMAVIGGIMGMIADAAGPFTGGQAFVAGSYELVTQVAFWVGMLAAIVGYIALKMPREEVVK